MDDQRRFRVQVTADASLTVDDVWPDGGAPDTPTVQDVIDVIRDDVNNPVSLMRVWNLEPDAVATVDGEEVW